MGEYIIIVLVIFVVVLLLQPTYDDDSDERDSFIEWQEDCDRYRDYLMGSEVGADASPFVYLDVNGYYRFSDSDRLVHRWVTEKKYGRKLRAGEVAHHIDGNKKHNTPDNLCILSEEQHNRLHGYE